MRAVVLDRFGGPEVLVVREAPRPEPGPGEARVRVAAVSVNPGIDCRLRAGRSQFSVTLPVVPGVDPAGVVDAVGPGVDPALVGRPAVVSFVVPCGRCGPCTRADGRGCERPERVGVTRDGGYAEFLVVPASALTIVPDGLDLAVACVVARHFPTARVMARVAEVRAGESALVMGAAGGLGSALVQVLAEAGLTVVAAAGDDRRVAAAVELGADHGANYRAAPLADQVHAAVPGGVDVVFENVGDPTLFPGVQASMAWGGRLVTVGAHGGGTVPLDVGDHYERRLVLRSGLAAIPADEMSESLRGAAEGRYRALVQAVLPLAEAPTAHELAERRDGVGKVLLDPRR